MAKIKVVFTIEEEQWSRFKYNCDLKLQKFSTRLAYLVEEDLKRDLKFKINNKQ